MSSVVLKYDNDFVAVVDQHDNVEIQSIGMYAAQFCSVKLDDTDFIWEVPFKKLLDESPMELYDDFKLTTSANVDFSDFTLMIQRLRVSRTVLTNPKY